MSSVTQKVGSSGKVSPYWRARFKGPDTRVVWLTTKCRDRRKASAIAARWEAAAHLCGSWELTQLLAQKMIADVQKIYPHPSTLAITRTLVDQLLRDSIGTTLGGQSFQQFATEWLESKEGKTAPATLSKYRGAIERFLRFLPGRRRIASVASISAGEFERFRDAELRAGKTAKMRTGMNIWRLAETANRSLSSFGRAQKSFRQFPRSYATPTSRRNSASRMSFCMRSTALLTD
jgi:hypothetical protein